MGRALGTHSPGRAGDAEFVAGVRLSHAGRVLFPGVGATKLRLARYYETIADWALPHVADRPLTLVRCPNGVGGAVKGGTDCFYMKHSKVWAPPGIRRVRIREKKKTGEYLVADTLPALVGLRNNRTNTSIAAFSTRARPDAPVSMPIAWAELSPSRTPDRFTLATVPSRLARLRKDPWHAYWSTKQRLPRHGIRALEGM